MDQNVILCYGDSNTWGLEPITEKRYAPHIRWPGVLRKKMGSGYQIVEEGLSGRTTVWDDPVDGSVRNGLTYLIPCLESHAPLHVVIVMLGTNDLKTCFSPTVEKIATNLERVVRAIPRALTPWPQTIPPKILIVAPAPIRLIGPYQDEFREAEQISRELGIAFGRIAETNDCAYLDAGTVVSVSGVDGVHLDAAAHQRLGEAIADTLM